MNLYCGHYEIVLSTYVEVSSIQRFGHFGTLESIEVSKYLHCKHDRYPTLQGLD